MAEKIDDEFREIGHCGGQFSVSTRTSPDGRRSYQVGVQNSSPTPASVFMIGALQQGIPVVTMDIGGWAPDLADENPQPSPVFPIMIASDREGLFGHQCSQCDGYWRSNAAPARWPITCSYCGLRAETHNFLTDGQRRFVERCCVQVLDAVNADEDGEQVIDMDLISDEIANGAEPPPFYYSEISQQSRFQCEVCRCRNDILGKYGYCSCCGSRNNFQLFKLESEGLNNRLQKGSPAEEIVKIAVSQFDSFGRNYLAQLGNRVALTPKRRKMVESILFHDLELTADNLIQIFDIRLFKGLHEPEKQFLRMMFQRRHVYEHNAGVADEKYLKQSGDTSVRVGEAIRETKGNAERLTELVMKMAVNLHQGFHEIFPLEQTAVEVCGPRDRYLDSR